MSGDDNHNNSNNGVVKSPAVVNTRVSRRNRTAGAGAAAARRQSTLDERSTATKQRGALQRSKTDMATSVDSRLAALRRGAPRKKKKGIRVTITVGKNEDDGGGGGDDENNPEPAPETAKNEDQTEEDLKIYNLNVTCSGNFKGKGNWPDVNSFWQDRDIDKEIMCDLLEQYSNDLYPERRGAENLRPKRCYLRDEPLRGISFYKDWDWDPVTLNLKADKEEPVTVLECWTRRVTLEKIPVDFSTDLETILINQGDKVVTSTLTKSKLQGHPLAMSMMKSETQIVTQLQGLESVVFCLGNHEDPDDFDPETGASIWRDVKTLRTLLHDKPFPRKEGKGTQRMVEVVALETFLKARMNYTASFDGDVVSDHGVGLLLGERWWSHPLKDIMMGYNVENKARISEEIELRFFSEIGYKMDNEYFDWENHKGKWVKVKKLRNP